MFLAKHDMTVVRFDGCMLGVVSRKGSPILKPWRVATTMKTLAESFTGYRCDGSHEHVVCRGVDAKLSENYTPRFAAIAHHAFAKQVAGSADRQLLSCFCLPCLEPCSPRLPPSSSSSADGMWETLLSCDLTGHCRSPDRAPVELSWGGWPPPSREPPSRQGP